MFRDVAIRLQTFQAISKNMYPGRGDFKPAEEYGI